MKHIGLSLVLLLAFAGVVSAQVSVEVLMAQDQFLPSESIPVRVRLVNNSGQTIRFGKEDWLSYSIEAADGTIPLKTGETPQPHDFEVKAAEMVTTPRTDLSPYFNVTKPGRYGIVATAHIKDWDKDISSPPKFFQIISGITFWEQDFGLPQSPDDHNRPQVRKYILQKATLLDKTKLYLRVADASDTKTLRIYPVGPIISFASPQMRVDHDSDLHLLYQTGARVYSYLVFNPDGDIKVRQTYHYNNSAPHLKVDNAGNALIVGGERHLADSDVPATRKSILTNDVPPPVP
jgi:hypothetical protein